MKRKPGRVLYANNPPWVCERSAVSRSRQKRRSTRTPTESILHHRINSPSTPETATLLRYDLLTGLCAKRTKKKPPRLARLKAHAQLSSQLQLTGFQAEKLNSPSHSALAKTIPSFDAPTYTLLFPSHRNAGTLTSRQTWRTSIKQQAAKRKLRNASSIACHPPASPT